MYFWSSYPFVRLSIALIFGIVCYDQLPALWSHAEFIICLLLSAYFILILIARKNSFYQVRYVTGSLALSILFFAGGHLTSINYHSHEASHYLNNQTKISGFEGTIVSAVNERKNHFRYDFEVRAALDTSRRITTGQIHLYIKKDTTNGPPPFTYGDQLLVKGAFSPVPDADNPNEFNYKAYLERSGIYSHVFVEQSAIRLVGNAPPYLFLKVAYQMRHRTEKTIDRYIKTNRENAIAKALLLGIKDHLDNDLKKAYAAAGAMHVLAVSGLHVGIVYLLLKILLGRLRNTGSMGKHAFAITCIGCIWLYALVTGLSPSVMRAAVMFSFITIGQSNPHKGNIYNTLGIASFILLCYDPNLVYSVGFQLSFIAVIGIVYLQPKLYRLLDVNNLILDKAWSITCVSIAAQLATFPLTAYYFHQFPTYFLISNLLVIPAAFLILISGITMLLIDPIIPYLGETLGLGLKHLISLLNESIRLIEVLPYNLIEWIYLDKLELLLMYSIILMMASGLQFRSAKTVMIAMVIGLFMLAWNVYNHYKQEHKEQLIFYQINNKTIFDHIKGHSSQLFIDEFTDEELELLAYQINPNRLASHLLPITNTLTVLDSSTFKKTNALISGMAGTQKILIIDSTTFHLRFHQPIETDILLLENEAIKSIKWLKEHFNAKKIIIGNKSSYWYARKMKEEAMELDVQIHALKLDGALVIDL